MSERSSKRWRRATISINERALKNNLHKVREYAPNSKVMAVIKADAYGHGMLSIAKQLVDADLFAVAMPAEAFALRADGCTMPIVVLHGFVDMAELEQFAKQNISTVVHQREQLDILLANDISKPIDVWIKIDTGMHRLGISDAEVGTYFEPLRKCKNVANIYMMSHFANADDSKNSLNNIQLELFLNVISYYDAACSMANSAAIIGLHKSHFEIVRPGIMLYGSSPLCGTSATTLGLQAVMQFESRLIDIKVVKAGESIGYGSRYTADKDVTMGIVAVGYGDGYPRHAKNGTPVWINNQRCALLGRVSMDSLCVDLTSADVNIGDRVVLWGKELSVDEIAQFSDTIAYELLCSAGAASL
ncbi:MAG: alanine racemase [Gammaproteobacteria bacterium]|nr:alanine racemase [Gammaproteobacteria bacterium]